MADLQRGLVELLQDLDRRARPGREARNRALQKFQTIQDTVQFSSETLATSFLHSPNVWYGDSTPSSCGLSWSLGQWS